MKKTIIATLVAIAAISSQAQGLIIFSSSTQNLSTNNTGNAPSLGATAAGRLAGAGNYYFALFYSATATTVGGSNTNSIQGSNGTYVFNDNNWTAVPGVFGLGTNYATAGRFTAGTPNADGSTTIPNIAGGSSAQFVVVGWSSSLGTTLQQLEADYNTGTGFLGESAVSGSISTGNGGNLPTPNLFGGLQPQLQAFTLGSVTVPEPGTMALAALSGASLLLFRRRK
jgi:hypothetical protein